MGLRGPGSSRTKEIKRQAPKKSRRQKWQNRKLGRVERIIAFLESLPITKGILVGQTMKLLPGQRRFVKAVYGSTRRTPVRIGVKSEPRGNGKTGLLAGLALCHLLGPEAEVRGEIYSASIDRQMAALIFSEMEAIIMAVPEWAKRTNIQRFHKKIEVLHGDGIGSIYEALSADARRGHGLAPSLWIYDELAQAKNADLLDNLRTAMGKRKRSLGLVISTQAASNDHPLSRLIDDGLTGVDPSVVVQLTAAPPDADPFSRKIVRSANPALGIFLNETDVFSEMNQAKRVPAFEASFRNLRLNQRIDPNADARLTRADIWDQGHAKIDLANFEGKTCYAGLDLSSKRDLTALIIAFPEGEGDETRYTVFPFFWTPIDQLEGRSESEKSILKEWIRRGFVEGMPGPIIRYDAVARKIHALSRLFEIEVIAYDRWRIDDLKVELADMGLELPLEPFGQGHSKVMAPAIENFIEISMTGRLRHGGNAALTSSMASAVLTYDKAGNPMIDKPKSNVSGISRVDGAVALVMALHMAHLKEEEGYVTEGAMVL